VKTSLFFPYREYEKYSDFNEIEKIDKVSTPFVGADVAFMYNHLSEKIGDAGFTLQHGNGTSSTEATGIRAFRKALASHLALMVWAKRVGHFTIDEKVYHSQGVSLLATMTAGHFMSTARKQVYVILPRFAADIFAEPVRESKIFNFSFAFEYSLLKWMVDSRLYTTSGQDSLLQRLNDAEYQIETTLNRIRQIVSEGL
jgi:hypothetical protein